MKHLKAFEAFVKEAKKPGPKPYMTGLSDEKEEKKKEQMKKQAEMDDDDPNAYKDMPGDKEAREKGKKKLRSTPKNITNYTENLLMRLKKNNRLIRVQ
jgi:hypothetical protein